MRWCLRGFNSCPSFFFVAAYEPLLAFFPAAFRLALPLSWFTRLFLFFQVFIAAVIVFSCFRLFLK
jgi:hypothetical protein